MLKKLSFILICCCTMATAQQKARLYTSDITHFYEAFDLAMKDTANAAAIFDTGYFRKGSKGLRSFYKSKIKDKAKFGATVLAYSNLYLSIRPEVSQVLQFEATINQNFSTFRTLYPGASGGDIYFLIGRLTSNGTIHDDDLLIGMELLGKTPENSVKWPEKLKIWTLDYAHVPITVMHETVHINQDKMKREPKLLSYALREGAAEFITELVTGKTDASYADFKGRELTVWTDFTQDRSLDLYDSWHSSQEPKRPRNALYWAGYYVCKSYYEQASDKPKAIYDILHIRDSEAFYKESRVEMYMASHFKI